jgi:hypothetical protein
MPSIPAAKPIATRLLDSAPEAGSGLHFWLIKGARECQISRVSPDQAFDLIANTVAARGGEIYERDINKAISKAYSQPYAGGSYEPRPVWPEPDLGLIEQITMGRIQQNPSVLNELQGMSPENPDQSTGDIISKLFPENALICAGMTQSSTTTFELARVRERLHKFQLVVPSPMSSKTGTTQEGRESGRSLSNTGPRRFLVSEFDFKRTNKQGKPSKWVPLIDRWQANGATAQDAAAAIIIRMMKAAPLALVVYSGNVSLHAWWYCAGESEQEGSRLHQFMAGAAELGADTATYTRSQFVRMPGATRPDGRKQTVHYLDTHSIKREE